MNAAGVSPWPLVRPFLAAGLVVAALVAAIAVYISPWSLRELRDWATQVRADILTNIVQPGRFTTISGNLTFHIADRRPNGLLVGIFLDDRRDPKEHATYLAEQGEIVKNDTGSFLVLERAACSGSNWASAILGLSLSTATLSTCRNSASVLRPAASPTTRVKSTSGNSCGRPRTMRCSWRSPASTDRNCTIAIATPLYPIAFVVLAYAFLGPPQTTRQSRTVSLLALVGVVALLRLVGFLSVIIGTHMPAALAAQYVALLGAIAAGSWQISRGQAIEPAAVVSKIATIIGERLAKATAS